MQMEVGEEEVVESPTTLVVVLDPEGVEVSALLVAKLDQAALRLSQSDQLVLIVAGTIAYVCRAMGGYMYK